MWTENIGTHLYALYDASVFPTRTNISELWNEQQTNKQTKSSFACGSWCEQHSQLGERFSNYTTVNMTVCFHNVMLMTRRFPFLDKITLLLLYKYCTVMYWNDNPCFEICIWSTDIRKQRTCSFWNKWIKAMDQSNNTPEKKEADSYVDLSVSLRLSMRLFVCFSAEADPAWCLALAVVWQFRGQLWQCRIFDCRVRWPIVSLLSALAPVVSANRTRKVRRRPGKAGRRAIGETIDTDTGSLANHSPSRSADK